MKISVIIALISASLWLLALCSEQAVAANLYRYEDNNGRMVWDTKIPPEYVGKGYSIIDGRGRVLQVIPPALTAEESAEQARKLRELQLAEEAKIRQRERDNQLLRRFRTEDDIKEKLINDILAISDEIGGFSDNIRRANVTIERVRDEIRWEEENNRPVSDNLTNQLEFAELEVLRSQGRIEDLEVEINVIQEQSDADIARLKTLLNLN